MTRPHDPACVASRDEVSHPRVLAYETASQPRALGGRRGAARSAYRVKEIFATLQGEGANAGKAAVFVRFSGCNLWNGREETRASAVCRFCDTDFVGTDGPGGGVFHSAEELAAAVERTWQGGSRERFVVCTGGEPLLQLDGALVDALHGRGFRVAVETNGTLPSPAGVDWVCVSPKAGVPLVVTSGDELKLVVPQEGLDPADLEHLEFDHFYLQPMDGPRLRDNISLAVRYCLENPKWRLSIQMHKVIGIP